MSATDIQRLEGRLDRTEDRVNEHGGRLSSAEARLREHDAQLVELRDVRDTVIGHTVILEGIRSDMADYARQVTADRAAAAERERKAAEREDARRNAEEEREEARRLDRIAGRRWGIALVGSTAVGLLMAGLEIVFHFIP